MKIVELTVTPGTLLSDPKELPDVALLDLRIVKIQFTDTPYGNPPNSDPNTPGRGMCAYDPRSKGQRLVWVADSGRKLETESVTLLDENYNIAQRRGLLRVEGR